jgi:hypothetical protein
LWRRVWRVAPGIVVLCCDGFNRKDIEDRFVDESNDMLKRAVEEIMSSMGNDDERERG